MTVAIEIGRTATGESASLDLEELLATRLLVQGNSGSGKSHLLRRLLEQSVPWVQQAVIDPEGDFAALAEQYGHVVIDPEEHTERGLQVAAERVRVHRVATILNLEGFRDLDRGQFMALGSALSRRPMNVRIGPTETHSRHASPRLMPLPEARMDGARDIILAALPPETSRPARRPSTDIASQLQLLKRSSSHSPPNNSWSCVSNWTAFSAQFWQSPTPISDLSAFFIRSLLSAAGSKVSARRPPISVCSDAC
jgi:Helicase HerA, central domain